MTAELEFRTDLGSGYRQTRSTVSRIRLTRPRRSPLVVRDCFSGPDPRYTFNAKLVLSTVCGMKVINREERKNSGEQRQVMKM